MPTGPGLQVPWNQSPHEGSELQSLELRLKLLLPHKLTGCMQFWPYA
jgi:hypothetical protein